VTTQPPVPANSWFSSDPDALERFAREVEDLIEALKRTRSKAADAAIFRSPSSDPASQRIARQLAGDAHDVDGTPVRAISVVIRDLESQVVAARLAARDYRLAEQEAERRFRESGETDR
jgi:hypothetical protein